MKIRHQIESDQVGNFGVDSSRVLPYRDRLCVLMDSEIPEEILKEPHYSPYTVHPGGTMMYKNLKVYFWWNGIKGDIRRCVAQCLTCQQVKAEHQVSVGKLQSLLVLEWKWDQITMDFVVGLPRTQDGFDAIWVIMDRLTKSAHFFYQYSLLSSEINSLSFIWMR